MKRMHLVSTLGLGLCCSALPLLSSAATVGNRADTLGGTGKWALGFEWDGVGDRDLKFDSSSVPLAPGETFTAAKIDAANRLLAKGTVGVTPNIDVFVKLGASKEKIKAADVEPGFPDAQIHAESDWGPVWGIGAKAKLYESPSMVRVMADAQYLATNKIDASLTVDGVQPPSSSDKLQHKEWQAALYVDKTIGHYTPYAGIKYSDVEVENDYTDPSGSQTLKFKSDNKGGVFLGTDIATAIPQLSVNLEGRFVDENAGTVGVTWAF